MKKENNRLRKIRTIVSMKDGNEVLGVVIPNYLKDRWKDVSVYVRESGNCLVLESGAKISQFNKKDLNLFSKKIEDIYL